MRINLHISIIRALVLAIALPSVASALSVSATGNLSHARYGATTSMMSDGRVLIAGGLSMPTTTSSIEIYDPASGTFNGGPFLSLNEPRSAAIAVTLPTGQVLIAGGREDVGSESTLRTAELFDPVSQQTSETGMLGTRRQRATATLLADGRVLICGGFDSGDGGGVDGDPGVGGLASAEIYSPLSGMFSPTGSMSTTREKANAVLLADGRVLVIGGYDANNGVNSQTSEIYDPDSGQFSQVATMPGGGRPGATATLLTNGKVLIAGGNNGNYLASALIYSPDSNTYTPTGSMGTARSQAGAILLPSGKVLLVGGQSARFSATSLIESYDPVTQTFGIEGNLASARSSASVSMLADGRILVAGGYVPPPDNNHGGSILASAEILKQPMATATPLAHSMTTPRTDASSSILLDGRILVAGGRNGSNVLASAELFSDLLDTFTAAGSLATPREHASSALLPDGSVVLIGGRDASGAALASAERFNPLTSSFSTNSASLWHARYSAASALLANGQLLLAGGRDANGPLASAEIFDGHTGMFRIAGSLATARSESSTVLLVDGSVLVAGGLGTGGVLASAERFDPGSRSFTPTAGSLGTARRGAMTALLPNGKVLIAGGYNAASVALASAELFDPLSDTFSATGNLTGARADGSIMVMPDGVVMLVGGRDATGAPLATSEIYDPASGAFLAGPALSSARSRPLVALTSFGRALVAGGEGTAGTLASAETHLRSAFATTFTGQRPSFSVSASLLPLPAALILDGEGLRGSHRLQSIAGSEGSSGGTASTASNGPLLRLQRIDNQQVIYQAPDGALPWTDLQFTTPTLARHDAIDPASRMAGAYRVYIGVNGVESNARYVSLYWIEDTIFAAGFETGD